MRLTRYSFFYDESEIEKLGLPREALLSEVNHISLNTYIFCSLSFLMVRVETHEMKNILIPRHIIFFIIFFQNVKIYFFCLFCWVLLWPSFNWALSYFISWYVILILVQISITSLYDCLYWLCYHNVFAELSFLHLYTLYKLFWFNDNIDDN